LKNSQPLPTPGAALFSFPQSWFPEILVMNMQRRTFLQRALLGSTCCVLPACRRGVTKSEVLAALVEQVVVPNTAALAQTSRGLDEDIARLVAAPTLTSLRAAREQWQRALLSWKRADAFRNGPIMDNNCLLRVMFWPVRPAALDALLQSTEAIDDASIKSMGVDRRGLFALEYLLYSAEADETIVAAFAGPAGERRARLARSLAGNVSFDADNAARSLGNGKAYAGKFADGGQDNLNRLALQLTYTVENLCAQRLVRISALAKSGRLAPTDVEASGSRMSQQVVLTYLRAAEELYLGVAHGLSELVKAQSPAVDEGLRSAFSRAISAVSHLGLPLEEIARREPAELDAAANVLKKLERALKSDLASTLGVTSTSTSVDGD